MWVAVTRVEDYVSLPSLVIEFKLSPFFGDRDAASSQGRCRGRQSYRDSQCYYLLSPILAQPNEPQILHRPTDMGTPKNAL